MQLRDLAKRRDALNEEVPEMAYRLDCLCQKEEFVSQILEVCARQVDELWLEVDSLKEQIEVRLHFNKHAGNTRQFSLLLPVTPPSSARRRQE